MQTKYVVDTTVIVSWLLAPHGLTAKIVRSMDLELFTPYKAVSELWEHQEDWSKRRPTLDLQTFSDSIGYYVQIEMVDQSSSEMREARVVMNKIDLEDSEFVALALKLKIPIWSRDKHFQEQNRVEVVRTDDLLKGSIELPSLWEALKEEWFKMVRESRVPRGTS